MTDRFAAAREVAAAVLYEGYVLYPYRASSAKNQSRFQFGVLMPPRYIDVDASERASCTTDVVIEARRGARLAVEVDYLQLHRRADAWDEATEQRVPFEFALDGLRGNTQMHGFGAAGALIVGLVELPGPYGALRLTVTVENRSAVAATSRDDALPAAFVATHTLLALDGGRFVSMTDPAEWASGYVASCHNEGTWPVLVGAVGTDSLVLSSPIILGDHPQIAPESPGELYDATEIDEILTLRTMALTDAEKTAARATDPRAAAVIDRVDNLPPEHLDRLHGALRYLRSVTQPAPAPAAALETLLAAPEEESIVIDGVPVSAGSRVRLRPGRAARVADSPRRRTDAQDLFLAGRTATVERVLFDVDGQQHVGVTVDDDAELAELQRWHGRFLYFAPDEVEPLTARPASGWEAP